MSERMLRRILVIVGVLVVVYGAVRVGAYATRPRGDTGGTLATALERLRADTLASAVVVSPAGERVEVRRVAAGWTVNGYRADSMAVDRLLRALREASTGDLVARNAANHARLGVTRDSAWMADFRTGRDTTTLLIGHAGPEYGVTFVRLPTADEVYAVRGGLREALARSLGDWRDKIVVRADTAAVRAVVVERDGKRARIESPDKGWKPAGAGGAVDSTRVADVLAELARFDASGFPPDTASFEGKDSRRVVALGAKGDTLAAIELAGDGSKWLARSRGSTQLFEVAGYRVDRLTPKVDELVRSGGKR
jgi:hypothetical protein